MVGEGEVMKMVVGGGEVMKMLCFCVEVLMLHV